MPEAEEHVQVSVGVQVHCSSSCLERVIASGFMLVTRIFVVYLPVSVRVPFQLPEPVLDLLQVPLSVHHDPVGGTCEGNWVLVIVALLVEV